MTIETRAVSVVLHQSSLAAFRELKELLELRDGAPATAEDVIAGALISTINRIREARIACAAGHDKGLELTH